MQGEHGVVVLVWRAGFAVGNLQLKDGWRVDDAAVAFAEAASSRCGGLLADAEVVVEGRRLSHWRFTQGLAGGEGSSWRSFRC